MTTIEMYDSKNLQDKILIWNCYMNYYETFRVLDSRPGSDSMSIEGHHLFCLKRFDWFYKVREDISLIYIVKEVYKEC